MGQHSWENVAEEEGKTLCDLRRGFSGSRLRQEYPSALHQCYKIEVSFLSEDQIWVLYSKLAIVIR